MEGVAFSMTNTLWPIPGYHRVANETDSGYQTQKYNTVYGFELKSMAIFTSYYNCWRSNMQRFFFLGVNQ
jgi:hypothetical protein